MPVETKKVLWTVLSVVIVLVVSSGIALALLYPKSQAASAPVSVAASVPPRAPAPDAYLRSIEPAPVPTQPAVPSQEPNVIIVYGDKPDADALPSATSGALPAAAPGAKPYEPAGSTAPGAASPAPQASAASPAPAVKPAPAAKPVPAAKPAAKPVTSVAEFWIQAAAFTSRTRADDLQRELAAKSLSSLITVKDIDGATWYRVRIGPYTAEAEAKRWLEKIRALAGCGEAYVSKQVVQR